MLFRNEIDEKILATDVVGVVVVKPPLVIFDFDGTLCDSYNASIDALNFFSKRFGYRKIADSTSTVGAA